MTVVRGQCSECVAGALYHCTLYIIASAACGSRLSGESQVIDRRPAPSNPRYSSPRWRGQGDISLIITCHMETEVTRLGICINFTVNNSEKSTCFRTLEIFPRVGGCFTLTGCLAWSALLSLATSFAFLPALITGAGQERVKSNFKLGETLNTQPAECWVGTSYYTVDTTRSLLLFKYLMSRNASFDRQGLIIKLQYN